MPMSGPSEVVSVTFSPDDTLIAAGDLSFPINIWNVQSGIHLRTIKDPRRSVSSVSSLVFSRNGKILVSGDSEKSLKFWSVTNGELLRSIDEADSVRSI